MERGRKLMQEGAQIRLKFGSQRKAVDLRIKHFEALLEADRRISRTGAAVMKPDDIILFKEAKETYPEEYHKCKLEIYSFLYAAPLTYLLS